MAPDTDAGARGDRGREPALLIRGAEAFNRGSADFSTGRPARIRRPHARGHTRASGALVPLRPQQSRVDARAHGDDRKYGPVNREGETRGPRRAHGSATGPLSSSPGTAARRSSSPAPPPTGTRRAMRLREIHFHPFDSLDAEERSFRAGQLHVTETIPPDKIDAYRADSPGLLRIDPLLGTYFMRINVRRPGLGRRAGAPRARARDRPRRSPRRILRGGQAPRLLLHAAGHRRLFARPRPAPRSRPSAPAPRRVRPRRRGRPPGA
jgi:hypothetical protein